MAYFFRAWLNRSARIPHAHARLSYFLPPQFQHVLTSHVAYLPSRPGDYASHESIYDCLHDRVTQTSQKYLLHPQQLSPLQQSQARAPTSVVFWSNSTQDDTLNRAANMSIENCCGSHTLIVQASVDRFRNACGTLTVGLARTMSNSGTYPLSPRFFGCPALHNI